MNRAGDGVSGFQRGHAPNRRVAVRGCILTSNPLVGHLQQPPLRTICTRLHNFGEVSCALFEAVDARCLIWAHVTLNDWTSRPNRDGE